MDLKEKLQDYFDLIKKENDDINAFRTLCEEEALKELETTEDPFFVVYADSISTKGIKTTGNSKMLEDYVPPFDATIVERVKEAGGITLGKTITMEFGVGRTENTFGANTAVAKGEDLDITGFTIDSKGYMHLGAFEFGLYAFKPTYGLFSRYGLMNVASSIDSVGILSKKFDNFPKISNVIKGKDEKDGTSFSCEEDFTKLDNIDLENIKVGKLETKDFEEIDDLFHNLNIGTEELKIQGLDVAIPTYEILSSGEFASNMERYDGISFGYRSENYENVDELYKNSRSEALGKDVQEKIMFGNFCLSGENYDDFYLQAMKARTMIKENFEKVLDDYEFIITSSNLYYTSGINLSGLPSLSIPIGKEGLLIISRAFNDRRLLSFTKELIDKMEGEL